MRSAVLPKYGSVACIDCYAVGAEEERHGADGGVLDVATGEGGEEEVGVDCYTEFCPILLAMCEYVFLEQAWGGIYRRVIRGI